jgi:hypothetical protein
MAAGVSEVRAKQLLLCEPCGSSSVAHQATSQMTEMTEMTESCKHERMMKMTLRGMM